MMAMTQFLPGTGRGTARHRRVVEGLRKFLEILANPSTSLQLVPLPVPGRNWHDPAGCVDGDGRTTSDDR